MTEDEQWSTYRTVIDAMADECRDGQGQVLPGWVRRGVWNMYAVDHPDDMPEEHRMNEVLTRLDDSDRAVVARMLELAYAGGMHDTLRVLNDHEVPPFDDAYEGTPAQDFMGRLTTDWEWPA